VPAGHGLLPRTPAPPGLAARLRRPRRPRRRQPRQGPRRRGGGARLERRRPALVGTRRVPRPARSDPAFVGHVACARALRRLTRSLDRCRLDRRPAHRRNRHRPPRDGRPPPLEPAALPARRRRSLGPGRGRPRQRGGFADGRLPALPPPRGAAQPPRPGHAPPRPQPRPGARLGHALVLQAPPRQALLHVRERVVVRGLPDRERRPPRLRRSGRPARRAARADQRAPRLRRGARPARRRSRRERLGSAALGGGRPPALLPRRRGSRRHGRVLAQRPADPQGAPVGHPARGCGLHLRGKARGGADRRDDRRTRGRLGALARLGGRAWLLHGAGLAPWRRPRGNDRHPGPRSRGPGARLRPPRAHVRPRGALALGDAPRPRHAERPDGVPGCARDRTASERRDRRDLAQLRRVRARPAQPAGPGQRLLGRAIALGNPYFQIESLYRFNAKFFPRWEPRFLLYEGAFGLPRVGLAAMRIEGQLPARRG
jgi:hypothetical protein